jgi:RNA polymerase sigma-70 factor, ECF subfamily
VAEADDRELVRRARQGDRDAFGELALRHRGRIHAALSRFTRDAAEAENLCQDAFLKAYLSLEQFEERSSFSTWLYRIAINLALNHAEKHKRLVPWDDGTHTDLLRTAPLQDELDELGERERLREAVDALPPRQKATLLLRDYEGLSFAEVAEALECPLGTAKANHFHAVRNLRKRLGAGGPSASPPQGRLSGVEST